MSRSRRLDALALADLRDDVFAKAHGMCEWPHCDQPAQELVHIVHRGMGGNPDLNVASNVLAGCRDHHRRFDEARLTASDLNSLLTAVWEPGGCAWPDCRLEVAARSLVRPDPLPGWLSFQVCELHKPVMDVSKPYPHRRRHIQDLLHVLANRRESYPANRTQMATDSGGESW